MSRVLLVTSRIVPRPEGGRELLTKLNHDVLRELCGDGLTVLELGRAPVTSFRGARAAFGGHLDGVTDATIRDALHIIETRSVEQVFLDGSNLGEMAREIKRGAPRVQVVTLLHNVEARFFAGALRQHPSPRAAAVLAANYLAERKAVRWSDKRVCLSARDSALLRRLYGREATHVSPMAVDDKLPPDGPREPASGDGHALFVGGTFYANQDGIAWFVKHVAPRIKTKTVIVGKGFERHRADLEVPGRVEVVGTVDDLAPWYERAKFVLAPIFDGSGMKTKVAEALMFGKKVIGTPDAFAGYEEVAREVGRVCTTADDFVAAIEDADLMVKAQFDPAMRAIYEANYSFAASKRRLEAILGVEARV